MNQSRDIPGVIAPPPLIALATLLLGLVLDWFLPSFFILRGILGFGTRLIIGATLIASGATIAAVAIRSFLRVGTNVDPWKPAVSLVTTGIFAYTRNPMYLALILILAGLAIALASDWMIVLLVPAALILHFGVVKREERYLAAKFAESYRDYVSKVSRYV